MITHIREYFCDWSVSEFEDNDRIMIPGELYLRSVVDVRAVWTEAKNEMLTQDSIVRRAAMAKAQGFPGDEGKWLSMTLACLGP